MREGDFEAWKAWRASPTDQNMQAILRNLDPLIQSEVNRWSGALARPLLEIEAKRLAVEAIQSFNPNAGAALGTHVTNRLKKLSRISYTHQNIARIPEYQTLKFHTFNVARSALEDQLGREPTADELSDQLGWSQSYLDRFRRSMRKEFVESGEPVPIFNQTSKNDGGLVDFVYSDLSPLHKKLFQHTTGFGGSKVLDNPALMKKLKMTQGQLSYQKRLLVDHLEKVTGGGIG